MARCALVVTSGGSTTEVRSVCPQVSGDEGDWQTLLEEMHSRVKVWVEELGLVGVGTTVLFAGPDTTGSISAYAGSAGTRRALLAARAATSESGVFSDGDVSAHEQVVHQQAGRDGAGAQIHVLGVADSDQSLVGLVDAVESTGLVIDRLVPTPGLALQAASREALSVEGEHPGIVLWLGDTLGAVACAHQGRLLFTRLVHVGVESLAEAITRLQSDSPPSQDEAREMLFRHGLPVFNRLGDDDYPLDVRSLLPLVQPVLQRLVVEIKQSVRFGLDAEVRDRATLAIRGAGGDISGLGSTLAESCGLGFASSLTGMLESRVSGDLQAAIDSPADAPGLEPRARVERRVERNVRRAVLVGAGLALCAIGLEASESHFRHSAAVRALASVRDAGAEGDAAGAAHSEAQHRIMGVRQAEALVEETLAQAPPLSGFLAELASLTPERVSLEEISLLRRDEGFACTLDGRVAAPTDAEQAGLLASFTESLRASPLSVRTSLEGTHRIDGGDEPCLAFTLTVYLVEVPRGARFAEADVEGGAP